MTKSSHQTRLWNFRNLVAAANGTNAAAEILGVRPSYITQIAGPKPMRTIGDRMASKIETKFGLAPGALDIEPPDESRNSDPFISEIVATMSHVTQADKEFILGMSEWIARRTTAERSAQATQAGKVDLASASEDLNYDVVGIAFPEGKPDAVLEKATTRSSTRRKNVEK